MPKPSERDNEADIESLSDEEFLKLSIETPAAADLAEEDLSEPTEAPAPHFTVADVSWVADFRNNPDTWHLPAETAEMQFDLTPQVIEGIIECGNYAPEIGTHNKLIVSLRGARLARDGNSVEDAASVAIKPVKPDHANFRCLIGVYDKAGGKISLYSASTVPFRNGVLSYYNLVNFGSGVNANLLPTGCYEHCVGTHFGSRKVPGVLRQGNGPNPESASRVTVLRTRKDLIYDMKDFWQDTKPSDNIHPAFGTTRFSSVGCQTVRGTQDTSGNSSNEWAKFQRKAGFNTGNQGTRYDDVLVTAHEAGAIAAALKSGQSLSELTCLRQGSSGELVKKVQAAIGVNADGNFGSAAKAKLAELQNQKLGFATGTCSRKMAELLGFSL